jgi:hypothetical protein
MPASPSRSTATDTPVSLMRRRKPCWAKAEGSAMTGAISYD